MRILAHRGLLNGANEKLENKICSISESFKSGFDIEFDINFDFSKTQLILSHNEEIWTKGNNLNELFEIIPANSFNALNIKNLFTLPSILNILNQYNLIHNFFLFDFELLTQDKSGCRFLMESIAAVGYNIAYRLSDREDNFKEYLSNDKVKIIWLDEFDYSWVKQKHVKELLKSGKQVFYVSPDLHGNKDSTFLMKKWEEMVYAGVTGICTDYPILLNKLAGTKE